VTIAIIGILVGLLIPAVAAVRRTTKEAACKATLAALETGLETFKADAKLGGMYPPSYSDANPDLPNNPPRGMVISPYEGTEVAITGAGLLVWALSGADLLGTPGFQPFGGASTWASSSSSIPTTSDAYVLDPNLQPVHRRYGPYVDGSKIPVSHNQNPQGVPFFAIPEERKAVEALGEEYEVIRVRPYPMYLDPFGFPVLYWRADPAGREMADDGRWMGFDRRAIYWWEDNARLLTTFNNNNTEVLTLNKAGDPHQLNWTKEGTTGGDVYWNHAPSEDLTDTTPFARYIRNNAVRARFAPQRPDSYLLVTAGADGRYGTGDDITNFAHNGQ
jgi:type II secretory pathway pseudopilin PulG